jgi:biopolymer transport protein ExbD
VDANELNFAGIDGYFLSTDAGKGSVTGFVYEDRDSNGQFDEAYDLPISDITVTVKAADGKEYNITTGADGHYTIDDVPAGDATVTVDENAIKANYPDAVQTAGDNPTEITVEADKTTDAGSDSFNFMDGGLITGFLYKDENKNGQYDEDTDTPISDVRVKHESENADEVVEVKTNEDGVWYAYVKDVNGSNVTVTVNLDDAEEQTGGEDLTVSEGRNPSVITLEVGKMNVVPNIGYKEAGEVYF